MPKKTYRTYYLKSLQILTKDENGKRIEVVFRGGIQVDSTAKFSTDDKALQDKLESLDGFGKIFYLESVKEDKVEEPAKVVEEKKPVEEPENVLTDVKDSLRFQNLVEMKNAMTERGIKVTTAMNYAQCKAAAAKEGYDFQIQKTR